MTKYAASVTNSVSGASRNCQGPWSEEWKITLPVRVDGMVICRGTYVTHSYLAAEAFTETAPGKHPPRVPFQVRYRDRTISVAEACGLVWNCTDIMPGSEFAALRDCLAEPPSRQTYAAVAHALLRELRDQHEVNSGTDARLKRLYDRRDTMIEETAKLIAAENGLDLTDPLQRGRARVTVDDALERWETRETED